MKWHHRSGDEGSALGQTSGESAERVGGLELVLVVEVAAGLAHSFLLVDKIKASRGSVEKSSLTSRNKRLSDSVSVLSES